MIKYDTVAEYLLEEYPDTEDLVGLIEDLVNGVAEVETLKQEIVEYGEHNQ